MDPRIKAIEDEYKRDLPAFSPGDTLRVRVRVVEGDKERIQPFEGICIGRRGAGLSETFTVRRVTGGVGVERVFPLHSPALAGLEVVRRGDVRRAKLYYLRGRKGKRARVRERRWWLDTPVAPPQPAADASGPEEEASDPSSTEDELPDEGPADLAPPEEEAPEAAGQGRLRAAAEAAAE